MINLPARPSLIAVMLVLVLNGCALLPTKDGPPPRRTATLPLVNCDPAMDDPRFWINKYMFPDKLLLTPAEIEEINGRNYERGLLTDIFSNQLWDYKYEEVDRPEEVNPDGEWDLNKPMLYSPGVLDGYKLFTYLKDETERIKYRTRWDDKGQSVPVSVFKTLDENLNLYQLKEHNPLCYGLTRRRTNVRYYPTTQLMTGRRWDFDFDIIQVSSVRAMHPVVILHSSRDREWLFVVTGFCRGWVKADDVVSYCDPEAIKRFVDRDRKLVVTGHEVDVFESKGNTLAVEKLYMGTVCPLLFKSGNFYTIALPTEGHHGKIGYKRAYIRRTADVHEGFLPFTIRNLLVQSFKLIHQPYSWGGKNGFRDCSQFIKDVYATMGLVLPRNSSVQSRVGESRYTFDSSNTVDQKKTELDGLDRPALLQFPGHIMLYLGRHGEHYYTIHDIWAYRVFNSPGKDDRVVTGQVVVSDMTLGEGSNKGSLIERLRTINLVKP